MVSTKFHDNRFRIDREIDEKHVLHRISKIIFWKELMLDFNVIHVINQTTTIDWK